MKTTNRKNESKDASEHAGGSGAVARDAESLCDAETGVCELPGTAAQRHADPRANGATGEVLYVGDPMCSACWGISPALRQLALDASARSIPFRILVGGLRAGGGDAWTDEFKSFLRHHWEEIGARTGQPFSTRFLERASFNYDTEPSCRAFVVLRGMLSGRGGAAADMYDVFAAIQRKFYADAEDPTDALFYQSICVANGLDFSTFVTRFGHADAKRVTAVEFQEVRGLGVRAFPTVLYRNGMSTRVLAVGYTTAAKLLDALDAAIKAATSAAR